MRAYVEGVAVLRDQSQKERALKAIARYTRLQGRKTDRGNLQRRCEVCRPRPARRA
jgi:hypothetical protein